MSPIPTSPIPKTAPFAEEEIGLLNRVVGAATPIQRAWLAGFLAGLDASQGADASQATAAGVAAAEPAAPARPAEPLTIVYASESGNCEKLANDLAKASRKNGLKPNLIDMADLDLADITKAKRLVVIAATLGRGRAAGARHARLQHLDERRSTPPRRHRVRCGWPWGTRPTPSFAPSARRSTSASPALGAKRRGRPRRL